MKGGHYWKKYESSRMNWLNKTLVLKMLVELDTATSETEHNSSLQFAVSSELDDYRGKFAPVLRYIYYFVFIDVSSVNYVAQPRFLFPALIHLSIEYELELLLLCIAHALCLRRKLFFFNNNLGL